MFRFYLSQHTKTMQDRHQLGLEIFVMKGFERHNKESNNTYRIFTNKKHDSCVQILKRLYDIFKHETCNIQIN